jgi:hypothetical protein
MLSVTKREKGIANTKKFSSMEYEKTLNYITIERFSDRTTLEIKKRQVEHKLKDQLTENLQKELEHINRKLESVYEKERLKLEKVRNQRGISE